MPHYNTAFTIDAGSWHHTTRRAEPPWRSWCKSAIWKSIRRHRLAEEPRCRQCAIEGRTVAASHVDHIDPHLGQWLLFFKYENTQSLCAHHHSMHKPQEKRGNTTHPPAERLDGAGPRVWEQQAAVPPSRRSASHRLSNALLDALAILVPKPQLVPPLGSFLSAASRSSASVGAESGVDVASSAPARCNVTRHREQNCQGSAHFYLSNRFRLPQVASDRYCSFAGLEILRQAREPGVRAMQWVASLLPLSGFFSFA